MVGSPARSSTPAPKHVKLQSTQLPTWLQSAIWASQYAYPGRNREGGMGNVVRLPFVKALKLNTSRNEIDAMGYVRSHTSVPVPKVFTAYEQPDGAIHILMEFVPGDGPDHANMTLDQIKAFDQELAGYLQQLRSLEPPEEGFIGSVSLGLLMDHRLGQNRFSLFKNMPGFHNYLRLGGTLETWEYDPVVKETHGRSESYKVKFTHADLNSQDIGHH